MPNPFQNNAGLLLSEEQVKKLIRDIMIPYLMNKDINISDASIIASIDRLTDDMNDVIEKTKIEKSFTWHSPFYIRVPKNTKYPINIEIDGLDASNRSVSIGIKVPASYFTNEDNKPHIIYANKYAIDLVKLIKYDKDTTSSTTNNILILEVVEIGSGTINIRSIDSEVREYKSEDDSPAITLTPASKTLKIEPDTHIKEVENIEQVLRTRSGVKYIDFITSAMMIKKELMNEMDNDTAYFTRDDDSGDNLSFKFNSLDEAKQQLPEIYRRIPNLWRYINIEFADTVYDISGLFENSTYRDTVRSITGPNISIANNLYRGSKITWISPELFSGCPNLNSVEEAFANTPLTEVPSAESLFRRNTILSNAKGLFEDTELTKDPEYWMNTNRIDYAGYVRKSTADPIAPNPYQGYGLNRAYPATYDVNNWVFKDRESWRTYYPSKITAYKSTDTIDATDLSKFSITIKEGDITNMFDPTHGIIKLPKLVVAERARSAENFAKDCTTIVNTDSLTNIFTKCPVLSNVTGAFEGCTGLTKGFEFLGASDTINNYTRVFKDCTNIDWTTLPYPWRWNGLDGYPDNIIGIDGFKNIPNLPNWVPSEWGGPGTEQDPNVHPGSRSGSPIINNCYIGDTMFTVSFTDLRAGDLVEISLVDPANRHTVIGDTIRVYASLTGVDMHFGIGDLIPTENRYQLLATDCIRIRTREMRRSPIKLWSEYVYQVPTVRLNPQTPGSTNIKPIGFITDGEVL